MRPKVVILILLAGLSAVTGMLLIRQRASASAPVLSVTAAQPRPADNPPAPEKSIHPALPAPAAPAPLETVKVPLTEEQQQAAIAAETGRLLQWGMMDDAASLSNILADLASPEEKIRSAAIAAAEQYDSTNAIPALQAAADATTNAVELAALREAIRFISLPNLFDGSPPHQRAKPAGAQ
jgi:type IV secretory pathway VirB10-like protein